MALVSPGVEITIIDQSEYISAAVNSVPYILIATAQNKISGSGAGVAAGTLAANADKVYLITSQRDLAATFGNPFFYKTAAGTPINGYELNEYGLLAANSVLGISNRAYVQRADIDLAELTASLTRPLGEPDDGTYWLDTQETVWGIFQWNATTNAFTAQTPLVLTDSTQVTGSVPLASIGSIGQYAVVTTNANNPVYYKNIDNNWVLVGSTDWQRSWPTVQGTQNLTGVTNLTGTLVINSVEVTVSNTTLAGLVAAINAADITGVVARADSSNRLTIAADITANDSSEPDGAILIDNASTSSLLTALGVSIGTYLIPGFTMRYNYQNPIGAWRSGQSSSRPTGSVWVQVTAVNQGTSIIFKQYDAALGSWITLNAPVYGSDAQANDSLDPTGGGANIPVGTIYTQINTEQQLVSGLNFWNSETSYDQDDEVIYSSRIWRSLQDDNDNNSPLTSPGFWQLVGPSLVNYAATFELLERFASGPTRITGVTANPTFTVNDTFVVQASGLGSGVLSQNYSVVLTGTTATDFVTDVSAADIPYVSASLDSSGNIVFTHELGGVIRIGNDIGTPITDAGFNTTIQGVRSDTGNFSTRLLLSNWAAPTYVASSDAPDQDPADGRLWYYSAVNQVDIMINDNGTWRGYRNVSNDVRGYNLTATDPAGPIVSATQPTEQSDGTPLVYGDLWIDTSNLELYPVIQRWQEVAGVDQWVTLDNTDQTTSNGVLFADARWAPNGTTDPVVDPIPSITSLLTSNYLDLDAPSPTLYPSGCLLFNTRRTGFNVKRFRANYFSPTVNSFGLENYVSSTTYPAGSRVIYNGLVYIALQTTTGNAPTNPVYWSVLELNAWVTAAGNKADGSPYMGRLAQRQLIVQAMNAAIDNSDTLREEQLVFNLLAAPNYPELIPNMVRLNNERNNTGFIVGDTPLRLAPSGNDIVAWATNNGGLGLPTGDGISTSDAYLGVFYPSCLTTDLTGSAVVQPPSHMMLRTIVRNDEVAYPWLAPAGVRRGVIDNATQIGYVNAATGEFVSIATGQGLRDVLYTNKINPITFIPGVGITNFGNKTEYALTTALDRINVARLVAFIRGRLSEIAKQFLFEPNDQITRDEISNAINGLMLDLVAKRGIYDYLVVCDLSNNTPARIDRNELYVDIAIEPVKAVEFIYIPVRIKNTGEISGGA